MHSEAFASAEAFKSSFGEDINLETVNLTESTAVLELLLQYMYRQPQPDLQKVDFEILAGVAEAAEKYQVYSATSICNLLMKSETVSHPLDVLQYAAKHGYTKIANDAAQETVGARVEDALKALSPASFMAWAQYIQGWKDVLLRAYQWAKFDGHKVKKNIEGHIKSYPCPVWPEITGIICRELGGSPQSLTWLPLIFLAGYKDGRCKLCNSGLEKWRDRVQQHIEEIAEFSTFLKA